MYRKSHTLLALKHRTANVEPLFQLIYQINRMLRGKKERANEDFFHLPNVAPQVGLEPTTL